MKTDRYVWIWLPGAGTPTLCGLLRWESGTGCFSYVRSYSSSPGAISIHPDWPLQRPPGDWLYPAEDDALPGVIADAAPGRWGEFVIAKQRGGPWPSPLEFLMAAGDERTGALGFSESATSPPESAEGPQKLETVTPGILRIEGDLPPTKSMAAVLTHGGSLGGRRPKATVEVGDSLWIAKFVSKNDHDWNQPRLEGFGLALARAVGIDVPDHSLVELDGKPVLLVRRFDRHADGHRSHVLSAKTLLALSERDMISSAASYPAVARRLCQVGSPSDIGGRWFDRMVYNIAIGNTDDHALNHLFGWDGTSLSLMPAFDLEPQMAAPGDRLHEMEIGGGSKAGSWSSALASASSFGLSPRQAEARLNIIVRRVHQRWREFASWAGITDRNVLGRLESSLLAEPDIGPNPTGSSAHQGKMR